MLMMSLEAFCLSGLAPLALSPSPSYGGDQAERISPSCDSISRGCGVRGGGAGRAQWCSNTHVLKACVSQCACRISVLFGKKAAAGQGKRKGEEKQTKRAKALQDMGHMGHLYCTRTILPSDFVHRYIIVCDPIGSTCNYIRAAASNVVSEPLIFQCHPRASASVTKKKGRSR